MLLNTLLKIFMPIETPPSVSSAIEFCLKPIARLCIHFGVDLRTLTEMMKVAFVTVAKEEFKVSGKSQTDSRIALLTGVHRKDVRRLLGRAPEKSSGRQQGLLANLIAQWLGTPELVDAAGQAKPIPRNPHPDYKYSFITMAGALTNDIHPRALLDECISRGIVRIDVDDRFVWHEGLTEEDAETIAAAARKAAMNALKAVNNQAVELKQKNLESNTPCDRRIHFGTFFYSARVDAHKTEAHKTEDSITQNSSTDNKD
ncbi:MAG: DUF6502 family protein [Methylotenera sp.]